MDNVENFSAYVVIPSYVLFDKKLSDKAKLLYGLISSMCNHKGYCWATNQTLMRFLGAESDRTLRRLLKELVEQGHIVVADNQGGRGVRRKIYLANFIPQNPDKNDRANPDKNVRANPDKNVRQNNINNNNTPYSPPEGQSENPEKSMEEKPKKKRIKRSPDGVVQLSPELEESFARFWAAWPKPVDKQKARERWDNLHPDESLLQEILTAIERQKQTPQWQHVRYIPGPARWLLNRMWEDEITDGKPEEREVEAYGWRT